MAFAVLCVVVTAGTTIFHILGEGRWAWFDCLYMTVITLSTVGFAEVLPGIAEVPMARAWTVVLILLGSGSIVYFASTLTALFLEGDLGGLLRRKAMQRRIEALKDHVLVCGFGITGMHVVDELSASAIPYVIVDLDEVRLERLREVRGDEVLYVVGDATVDGTLQSAGIERARGVIAALHEDKDNLFVTITARALNPEARIVAKAIEFASEAKLLRAGADAVVSPNLLGGRRLAAELVRPSVVHFFEHVVQRHHMAFHIEEVELPEHSFLVGKTLRESKIREVSNALVIAVRNAEGELQYTPQAEHRLEAKSTLILMGQIEALIMLRRQILGNHKLEAEARPERG